MQTVLYMFFIPYYNNKFQSCVKQQIVIKYLRYSLNFDFRSWYVSFTLIYTISYTFLSIILLEIFPVRRSYLITYLKFNKKSR